ncbi:MAG: hypothetical protein QME49_05740 [bacterium]|nr:hypothetical protein [bacterium]
MATQARLDLITKMNAKTAKKTAGNLESHAEAVSIETIDAIAQGVIEIAKTVNVVNVGEQLPEPAGKKYTVVWQAPSHIQIITLGESIEATNTEILFADGSKILIER